MIQENLKKIEDGIRRSCERSKRSPSEVTLVLVSKSMETEKIREAFQAGCRDFGENRVQELLAKKPALPSEIRWHFQGRLQTNKVKFLLGEIVLLHSLDRMELAGEIEKQAAKKNLVLDALLQVNTSGEATKAGFQPEEVERVVEELKKFHGIHLRGLMTIGPDPRQGLAPEGPVPRDSISRDCFRKLRLLRDELQKNFPGLDFRELSMGMSADFEWAIEEGATMVRIGTAVFGNRPALHESPMHPPGNKLGTCNGD